MDIPSLMISAGQEGRSFIENAIKIVKVKPKDLETKELLNVWLELNCDEKKISFIPFVYQTEESEKKFHYLGNNAAAGAQIFAVREVNSFMNYWTGRMNGILMNILKFLSNCNLREKLEICNQIGLFQENGLNFQFMPECVSSTCLDGKNFKINEETLSCEKWLSFVMQLSAKQKIVLIVPTIILNGEKCIISQDEDYIRAIERFLAKDTGTEDKKKKEKRVCHVCGQLTDSIDTKKFTSGLDRYSLSKIFVTTQVNYASQLQQKFHEKNFALCKACYDKWSSSEKSIMQNYKLRIAGEDAILLVDGIMEQLNKEKLSAIERKMDIAFNPQKYRKWLDELVDDNLEQQEIDLYEFNLVFFLSDGKSCAIKKSIEDISNVWFNCVLEEFENIRKLEDYTQILPNFSLNYIYNMIPVKTNNKREQLDINRVLEVYAAILQRNKIETRVLYDYFAEALECGHRQIVADEVRNFKNLYCIEKYQDLVKKKNIRGLEWYISYMCYAYQALMELLQRLHILQSGGNDMREYFVETGEENQEKKDKFQEREDYLNRHGFSDYAKGIYYVGAMMYQIAMMQYYQNHKNKPILEKVTYSGMGQRDIIELLNELHDKIRQYRKAMENQGKGYLVYNAEYFAKCAYTYLGNFPIEKKMVQNEHENLFYLMSGYSSCMKRDYKSVNEEDGEDD